jgi:hypothetical protein
MNDLNFVLSKLEEELEGTDPSNYSYFVRHRHRFKHDGQILKRFYKEGTILDITAPVSNLSGCRC